MSKIKKALERSKAQRAQNERMGPGRGESDTAVRSHGESDQALSERIQLEKDIRRLLQTEHPEELGTFRKEIKLIYTQTKTVSTDPGILKDNGVFALSHDMDVTKQIEILRAQVLKKLKQMNANSLMITSANHREGKTFTSINLAVSIAQSLDRTVMLVDTDLRNRSYKRQNMANVFLNSETRPGLSDYLLGNSKIEELLVNPGIPRLTILPSGKAVPDSAALLGSPRMEELIFEMKSKYAMERVLIFDCSSFLTNADAYVLSRYVDAVLLVVENEKTNIKDLERMIEMLKDNQIVGTVLNKFGMKS
ncbi:MAG: CpsD/CapB family tyrosine-protein kinase [Desulfobacteraceae bacterium]|jgi:non-specific protein-tyrosine kinase